MWACHSQVSSTTDVQRLRPPEEVQSLSSFAVVIPYFNPHGYRSHAMKLARCLEAFDRVGLGADVFVAGCGALRPHTGNVLLWDDHDCFMWHKERLVNLAAKRLAPGYTHLVWADNDILVRPGWPSEVERSFATAPIVQCFRDVTLLGPDWRPKECRPSYLHRGRQRIDRVCLGRFIVLFCRRSRVV